MINLNFDAENSAKLFGTTEEEVYAEAKRLGVCNEASPRNLQIILDSDAPLNVKLFFTYTLGGEMVYQEFERKQKVYALNQLLLESLS